MSGVGLGKAIDKSNTVNTIQWTLQLAAGHATAIAIAVVVAA